MLGSLAVRKGFLPERVQSFGECVVVVIESRLTHPRVRAQVVMLGDPFRGCNHARIFGVNASKDHAFQPGVGHGGVAAQPTVGGLSGLAITAVICCVVKPTVGILGREWCCVMFGLQILAAGDERLGCDQQVLV